MSLFANFLAGSLLCNFIPHLVAGLQGSRFPTPFARFHGSRVSSPVTNVLWGSLNLAGGVALLRAFPVTLELSAPLFAFGLGFLSLGVFLAWFFNRVLGKQRGRNRGA